MRQVLLLKYYKCNIKIIKNLEGVRQVWPKWTTLSAFMWAAATCVILLSRTWWWWWWWWYISGEKTMIMRIILEIDDNGWQLSPHPHSKLQMLCLREWKHPELRSLYHHHNHIMYILIISSNTSWKYLAKSLLKRPGNRSSFMQ